MIAEKILGVDIGSKITKLVLVKQGKKPVALTSASFKTPDNSVTDGEINYPVLIAEAIRETMAQNTMKASGIAFSISSPHLIVREIKLPLTKKEELEPAIRFEMNQLFPDTNQTHTIAYKINRTDEGFIEGIAVLCPNKLLEGYREIARLTGMPLKYIDAASNAMVKAFDTFIHDSMPGEVFVIADIGYTSSQVAVIKDGKLALSRHVSSGVYEVDSLMSERLGISVEDAKDTRINSKYRDLEISDEDSNAFIRIGCTAVENQLRQTIEYYTYNRGEGRISAIYLTGSGSLLPGVCGFFADTLNIPVSLAETVSRETAFSFDAANMLQAAGSTLRPDGDNDINIDTGLTEGSGTKKKMGRPQIVILSFSLILLLAGAAFAFLYLGISELGKQEETNRDKMRMYMDINTVRNAVSDKEAMLQNIDVVIEAVDSVSLINTEIFNCIASVMPEEIFALNYSISEGDINIAGKSADNESIAYFIYALKQLDNFTGVNIKSISVRASEDGTPMDYNFLLSLKLK